MLFWLPPLDRGLRNLTPARLSSSSCRAVKEDTPSGVGSRFPPGRCRHLSRHSPGTRDVAVPAPLISLGKECSLYRSAPSLRAETSAGVRQFEPGHQPPAAPSPAPPRREARNELEPPAAFRITARRTQLRHPRPGAVGDLDPDDAVPGSDRDRDRLPREHPSRSAGQKYRRSRSPATRPHPCTGARGQAPRLRTRGRPAPAPPGRQASRSPGPPAQPSPHPPFPGRPAPGTPAGQRADAGTCTLSSAANVKPAQRAPRTSSVARPWSRPPSVAVRAKPTVPRTAPWPRFPSAYLHRRGVCKWLRDGPFTVLGRASLCSLALITAGLLRAAGWVRGREAPAQRRRRARFLGYDITVQHSSTKITNGRRSVSGQIALRVPPEVVRAQCARYRQHGKPWPRPRLQNLDDYDIVRVYGAEYAGVVSYYLLARDVWRLSKLYWHAVTSMLKTLAARHHSAVTKMAACYRAKIVTSDGLRRCFEARLTREGKQDLVARFGGIALRQDRRAVITDPGPVPVRLPRKELLPRLRRRYCELCDKGATVAVHQVAGLKQLGIPGPGQPAWAVLMAKMRRKTLVVCAPCHEHIHANPVAHAA